MSEPATWNPNAGRPRAADPPFDANNTPEWWSISTPDGKDEVSLHQWGWSVTTVGGSRYDLPPRRGADMTTAYRPGQLHRRKVPDARPITLMMFMVGWDPATGDAPPDQRLQWNDNWDALRRLVYRNHLLIDQRFRLTRRWFLTAGMPDGAGVVPFPTARSSSYDGCIQGDPGVPTFGPRLLTAFGLAENTGTMAPNMTGRFRSEFQLDLTMADPYFYGDWVTARVRITGNSYPPVYIWNDGHDVAASSYMTVEFTAGSTPMKNPKLTNTSTSPDSYVQFNGTIAPNRTVRLLVNKSSAEFVSQISGTPNTNAINNISNYGSRWWCNMLPGSNRFIFEVDSGNGYADITFRPPYV